MVDNRLGDLLGVFATNNHQGVFDGLILPQDDRAFLVIVDRDAEPAGNWRKCLVKRCNAIMSFSLENQWLVPLAA
jgi:hypothetical protein